jgi:hypothetical protein
MTHSWPRRALVAVLAVSVLLGTAADGVQADSPTPAPQPGPAPQGIDGLLPPPPGIQHGNQPTLPERYPALAYGSFNVDGLSTVGNGLTDPIGTSASVFANWWAGVLMLVVALVAMLTSRLLEWIFTFDISGPAGGPLTGVVHNLGDQVYVPLLALALLLLAIWLAWQLLARRRTLHGLQGVGWALAALVLGGLYISAPAQVLGAVDGFTTAVSRQVLAAIGTGDPAMSARAGDPSFSQGDATDAELRMFADRYWRTFVFTPWSVAALGDAGSGQRYGEELLAKQAEQPSNFDADFKGAPQQAQTWYSGRFGGSRLVIVLAALVVVVLASVLYLVIAGTVVVAQLALVMLLMLAPLFLLVGIQPGTGRRMLIRWAELAAGALMLRILSAAFAAVLLVLSGMINQIASVNWLVASGLQVALVVAAFVYRKPFLRIFGQVASPRLTISHVSHPRTARALHSGTDWVAGELQRRWGGGVSGAARGKAGAAAGRTVQGRTATATAGKAGATVVTGVSGVGLALAALEAGKLGVRTTARATRALQGATSPLVLGGGGTPLRPSLPGAPSRRVPILQRAPAVPAQPATPASSKTGGGGSTRRSSSSPNGSRSRSTSSAKPSGRSYTNHRTGETVKVSSSKIVLPGAWRRERSS